MESQDHCARESLELSCAGATLELADAPHRKARAGMQLGSSRTQHYVGMKSCFLQFGQVDALLIASYFIVYTQALTRSILFVLCTPVLTLSLNRAQRLSILPSPCVNPSLYPLSTPLFACCMMKVKEKCWLTCVKC